MYNRICKNCGKEFVTNDQRKIYCKNTCCVAFFKKKRGSTPSVASYPSNCTECPECKEKSVLNLSWVSNCLNAKCRWMETYDVPIDEPDEIY